MSKTAAVFNKKKFINEVTETVRHMYRKQLKEASQQEIFQAVSYPNVNTVTEMTNLIDSTRAYEANATAFDATKSMATTGLSIGKQ